MATSLTTVTPTMTFNGSIIKAVDIDNDGKVDLIADAPNSGGYSTYGYDVYLNNGNHYFSNHANVFLAFKNFMSVDLNGDDKNDFLYNIGDWNGGIDDTIFFSLNNGSNYFSLPTYLGHFPSINTNCAVGDFNADGKPDIAITSGDSISVFFNDQKNGFYAPITNSYFYDSPIKITVADFNGDKQTDLLIENVVLFSNGTGDFTPITIRDTNTSSDTPSTSKYYVADFNGDGIADLYSSSSVLISNGKGNFSSTFSDASYTITGSADFNGDGKADLIANTPNSVILMSDGTGSFGTSIPINGTIRAVADFNGDGRADLILDDYLIPTVTTVQMNHGFGNFGNPISVSGNILSSNTSMEWTEVYDDIETVSKFTVADFNGDGRPDLITKDSQSSTTNVFDSSIFSGSLNKLSSTPVIALSKATKGNDQITGTAKAEKIDGLAGNDLISGLEGNDTLMGGAGLDTLIGGAGADNLTGGSKADVFKFTALADSGTTSKLRDIITDFVSKVDKIDISTLDANAKLAGDQAFSFIGNAAFSKIDATGQLRFDTTSHVLYGSVNADNKPEFSIQLNGVNSLVATDFIL